MQTAGDLAREHGLDQLRNSYGDWIPNDWPLSPEGGWSPECGDGWCDIEYVYFDDDDTVVAISCNTHHPREDAP